MQTGDLIGDMPQQEMPEYNEGEMPMQGGEMPMQQPPQEMMQ
jgi:hypothetical protein